MSTDSAKHGPQISIAQQIGDDANSALHANKPLQWNLGKIGGDDFGVDFQVTAFGLGTAGAQFYFNIQLKGTTQRDARSADGRFVSHAFDRTTLNLWHNSGVVIVVVLADLIDSRDPKEAKVYFLFANPELDDVLPTIPLAQKTLTLRIPTSQPVHRNLDIVPEINEYLDEVREARELVRARKRAVGGLADEGAPVTAASRSTGVATALVSAGIGIDAVIDSLSQPEEVRAALSAQRTGDYERVLRLAAPPTEEDVRSEPERSAIRAYLRALAFEAMGDTKSADSMIEIAASHLADNDDIAAFVAQRKLDAMDFGAEGTAERHALYQTLPASSGPALASVKAKILALQSDFDAARRLLDSFPAETTAVVLALISALENSWERVLSEVREARANVSLRDRQLLSLQMLEAHAYFELAMMKVGRSKSGDLVVPATGLPGIDYAKLRQAYDSSLTAMLLGQRMNWPADMYTVLDVFTISSTLVGYARDALPLLSAFAFARPTLTRVREVVAKTAVRLDQPRIAEELGDLAADSVRFENEDAVMAVASYKAGNVNRALGYVTDKFLANPSTDEVYLSSLLMMGIAANSALKTELLEKIKIRLDRDTEARQYGALLAFAVNVASSVLGRTEAIRELHGYWSTNGRSPVIGYHLLVNADTTNKDEARIAIDVASETQRTHSFGADHLAQLGRAFITLERYQDASELLRNACDRFRDDLELKTLLAVALELNGQSPEAFRILEGLLADGAASETARRYYVNIAVRMGFFDRAEEQVRVAYSKATRRSARLRLLNTLFQLLLAAGDRPAQVEEVAWEYGRLCEQDNEREEGIFLQEYLVATLPQSIEVRPERVEVFRERLQKYLERFPKSKYLSSAQMPADGPPDAFVEALREASGITNEDIARGEAVERQMDRGSLYVPFSWRPRRFLRNVSDIFMLWQMRKHAPLDRAAFHFPNSVQDYARNTPQDLRAIEPVLSLTSLLLLDEVRMLEKALDCFDRVVIARATIMALQEARSGFFTAYGAEQASRITTLLQKRFDKISHPPLSAVKRRGAAPDWHEEEKLAMASPGRVYFCDDIIETFMVCGGEEAAKSSMSLVEFVTWADRSLQVLTPRQVAEVLGRMVALKIGAISIRPRYVVAAIPDALQFAKTEAEESAAFSGADALRAILDGLWDSSKPFSELQAHFGRTMTYLIDEGNASESVLVALWLRWLQAVRFQANPPLAPLQKLAASFIAVLGQLQDNKTAISRLWQSFWLVIKKGLASTLKEPEDIVGTRIVARALGGQMAKKETAPAAGKLFDRAKLGLEAGTALANVFNDVYVTSAAEETQRLIEEQRRGS